MMRQLEQCRVYQVSYSVIDGNASVIATIPTRCVIAIDVADVVDQIRKSCLGIEVTGTTDGKFYHGIAEHVEIESVKLIGRLHGITDKSFAIITVCDQQESV